MRLLMILCVAISLRAEVVQPQQNPGQPLLVVPPPAGGSNTFPVFDSGFFNSKQEGAAPAGGGRYKGKDAEINTDISDRITEECRSEIDKSMKDFRKCFDRKKKDEMQKFRTGREDVERRQQMPLSNVPPIVEDLKRPPSSEE